MDLYKKYSHKLVKIDLIKKKVGKFPRKNKIILCHGVFDIVHPGHIRHLTYAKSQCDILVVSCTSDKFIDKGVYRPHIPQKMRALNLAALLSVPVLVIENKSVSFFI